MHVKQNWLCALQGRTCKRNIKKYFQPFITYDALLSMELDVLYRVVSQNERGSSITFIHTF